ncbi:hypothetical protein CAL7716_101680 (plasmid) [Calothrix sp. PCC 7716]|nr:hypothetical protein CAL7716_101680 [Calothrix sp. PCC 7716]
MTKNDFSIKDLSLRELQKFESLIPELAGFPSRILVETYEEFIDELYKSIDKIVYLRQENRELYQQDKEDRITIEIKNALCLMGYNASHDQKIGGHADIVVKKNEYLWIGEAKIHKDYNYLWEGFQQLNTRYSTGDCNQKDGALLIYIFVQNAKSVIENWKEYLFSKNLLNYSVKPCCDRELAFFSNHTHDTSGNQFRVKHIGIMFYFKPKDKSAMRRNKN